ncbi:MAG TPA: hypothetical protein VE710_22465 [Candidatus Bathyarchaeia archaeon]|nr:hypothetical protein [Candidatus Bathyarchaeia archaeon]
MNKEEFIMFTSLTNYLKELGTNPAEYLSREALKRYTEYGENYVNMDTDTFRTGLENIIKGMAEKMLGSK